MSAAGRASITTRDRDDSHRARDSSRTASTRDVRRRARRGWRRARRGDAVRGVKIHIRRARQRLLDLHGLSVGGPIEGSSHERRHAGERSARPDDDRAACLVRRALDLPAAGESESRRAVAVPPATLAVRRTHGPGERSDRRHVVPRGVGTRGNLRSVARSRRRPRHRPRGAHQGDLGAAELRSWTCCGYRSTVAVSRPTGRIPIWPASSASPTCRASSRPASCPRRSTSARTPKRPRAPG